MKRAGRWLFLGIALAGCGGGDGGAGPLQQTVATVTVIGSATTLTIGAQTTLVAAAADAQGRTVSGRTVTWSSNAEAVATVSSSGVVTAVTAGTARITATIDNKSGSLDITVALPPVVSVTITPSPATVAVGATLQLAAELKSGTGAVLTGRNVTWQSGDVSKATVNATTGLVTGVADGQTTITATSEGVVANVSLTVGSPAIPVVSAITPAILVPGSQAVLTVSNASAVAGQNTVTVDGVAATVVSASPTQITISLPAAGFTCRATRPVEVKVSVGALSGARNHPLQVATQLTLTPGQHRLLLEPAAVRCNELAAGGGRYVVAVVNSNRTLGSTSSFTLFGEGATAGPQVASAIAATPAPQQSPAPIPRAVGPRLFSAYERALRQNEAVHLRTLEQMREGAARLRPVRRSARAQAQVTPGVLGRAATEINPTVGAISKLAIPDYDKVRTTPGAFLCAYPDAEGVAARTVYAGQKVLVLEDTLSALRGQMDDLLTQLGQIFDAGQFDVVHDNFGDPLALDDEINQSQFGGPPVAGVGKVIMLFTPKMKKVFGETSIGGQVTLCDFLNPGWFAPPEDTLVKVTNKAAVFYATPPTSADRGFDGTFGNRDWWRYLFPTIVVHETKHISSFANRMVAALQTGEISLEESWLEEGSAMHAMEIWARTLSGATLRGNAMYENTLFCDFYFHQSQSPCNGRPSATLDHWTRLYRHMAQTETRTIFGDPSSSPGLGTFYGSTWMLLRWLIDHSPGNDAAFLGALNREPTLSGTENIEARAGRPFAELLSEWHLALAVDDRAAFTPTNARLTIPSWNLADIFGDVSGDVSSSDGTFSLPYPLVPRPVTYPSFTEARSVTAGSASFFELSGTQPARQLLELRAQGGGNPPAGLRLAIVRVQ